MRRISPGSKITGRSSWRDARPRSTATSQRPDVERMTMLGFLAGYRGFTRDAYALDLRQFTTWCWQRDHQLFNVHRVDIECFARDLEDRGKARATVAEGSQTSFWARSFSNTRTSAPSWSVGNVRAQICAHDDSTFGVVLAVAPAPVGARAASGEHDGAAKPRSARRSGRIRCGTTGRWGARSYATPRGSWRHPRAGASRRGSPPTSPGVRRRSCLGARGWGP